MFEFLEYFGFDTSNVLLNQFLVSIFIGSSALLYKYVFTGIEHIYEHVSEYMKTGLVLKINKCEPNKWGENEKSERYLAIIWWIQNNIKVKTSKITL
jgi:hypothetical protein